ncbi:hypothetical protein RclHR1_02240019 [Rhizophagus clarus]|uniref:Jacalin-type lectin domain-containing protein n=1 Tax=Rhizophagus clarus TaxID=94130 RepID=A0A2Z6QUF7_9GLOM|nr:hypothetical protein RclHR1_02240019 [Rhizophagus clarus]
MREDTITTNEQNRSSQASGSEMFNTSNSEFRNRQRQSYLQSQPIVNDQFINRTNRNRRTCGRCCRCCCSILVVFIIIIIVLVSFKNMINLEEYKKTFAKDKPDSDSIFENLAKMAESTSKKIDEFDIPGTSVMNKYRAVFVNLGVILNTSSVIVNNGVQISRVLFELSDHYKEAGKEILGLKRQANSFFESLSSELDDILDIVNKKEILWGKDRDLNDVNSVKQRLRALQIIVPDLQVQLGQVIKALKNIEEKSLHTQSYLMTGEKEAQDVLKQHWLGDIADYNGRKRAEEERKQVLYVLQLLKDMLPNLYNFQDFLEEYDKQLQDVYSQFDTIGIMYRPSKKTLNKLISAAKRLEASHKNFNGEENRLGQKPKDHLFLEDDMNTINRDCTEFKVKFKKSDSVYLNKIRVWSSHSINALAFYFSDGSVEMFGTPGHSEAFDFEWHKDEKIKRFIFKFASVVYGIEIITTEGRSTGWHGGHGGQAFYTEYKGNGGYDGLFGSFSKYICSLEVL